MLATVAAEAISWTAKKILKNLVGSKKSNGEEKKSFLIWWDFAFGGKRKKGGKKVAWSWSKCCQSLNITGQNNKISNFFLAFLYNFAISTVELNVILQNEKYEKSWMAMKCQETLFRYVFFALHTLHIFSHAKKKYNRPPKRIFYPAHKTSSNRMLSILNCSLKFLFNTVINYKLCIITN